MARTNFDIFYDQEYKPYQNSAQVKIRRKKAKKVDTPKMNSKKWTSFENERYLEFVKNHGDLFYCPDRRKGEKVFLRMSNSVKTRTSDQCRSHHQKMIKHHMDLEGIVKDLEERLQIFIEKQEEMEQPVEGEKLQNIELKNLDQIGVSTFMQNESQNIKLEQKQEQNFWGLLDKDVWVAEQIFCFSAVKRDQQI